MMPSFEDFLKAVMGESKDFSKWVQVGTLTSDEIMQARKHKKLVDDFNAELILMRAKAERYRAEAEESRAILWNKIEKEHSLPHDRNYHFTDDWKILMQPKPPKETA